VRNVASLVSRKKILFLLPLVGMVLALGVALAMRSPESHDALALDGFGEGQPEGYANQPVPPTAQQCEDFHRLAPQIYATLRADIEKRVTDEQARRVFLVQLDAARERSDGCPADPVLGVYPSLETSGDFAFRLLDWPPPAASSGSWITISE
jgi:hypothetical protein